MPTKITITDVDLGISIDDIIGEEIRSLTGASQRELDNAIDIAKATQKVKSDRESAAEEANQKLTTALDTAYQDLLKAGDTGLPVSAVMAIVVGAVPNSSAFTVRMKGLLSNKGNLYRLDRKKFHGTQHYVLIPFNQPVEAPK